MRGRTLQAIVDVLKDSCSGDLGKERKTDCSKRLREEVP